MDGAQQIDGGTGVSASENGVRALNSEKSLLKCLKTPGFQAVGVKSQHLKNHVQLLQFEMRHSDHP